MAIGFIVASECKYEAMQWLLMRKYALLAFDFIQRALEFGKIKIKLLEMTFKGKQSIFPYQ